MEGGRTERVGVREGRMEGRMEGARGGKEVGREGERKVGVRELEGRKLGGGSEEREEGRQEEGLR